MRVSECQQVLVLVRGSFTATASRPIQSIRRNVHGCVCLFVPSTGVRNCVDFFGKVWTIFRVRSCGCWRWWQMTGDRCMHILLGLHFGIFFWYWCYYPHTSRDCVFLVCRIFTESASLGQFSHRVAGSVCQDVCLRHRVQFFPRPLIGPEITWSVPGLWLVHCCHYLIASSDQSKF